ncbi:MAG: hypothetical protein ACJ8F7_00490 [Gemmataceae bacterium]
MNLLPRMISTTSTQRRPNFLWLLVAVVAAGPSASAQQPPGGRNPPSFAAAMQLEKEGKYLAALRALGKPEPSGNSNSTRLQVESWARNAVGQYDAGQKAFNDSRAISARPTTPPTAEELKAVRDVPLVPAEELVLDAVKRHQVVILNEAHHQPEGRALGARIIPRLPALGVKYFALETGNQAALDQAVKTGLVKTDTDPYSFDPPRAGLLRAVVSAGLTPVAIDLHPDEGAKSPTDPGERLTFRESSMARHLQGILKSDSKAKVFVWVGFSHALKTPQGPRNTTWMAARFWKETGIEPFSIYQMSDASDPALADPIYRLMVMAAGREVKAPMATRLPVESFGTAMPAEVLQHPVYSLLAKLGADAVVLHPRKTATSAAKRPAWLRPADAAEIEGQLTCGRADCFGFLVQAVRAECADGDATEAPFDQVVTEAAGAFALRVPAGSYKLRVWALPDGADKDVLTAVVPAQTYAAGQKVTRDIRIKTEAKDP